MIVLGIHDGHDASAAVLVDGQLVAAAQEERFSNRKNQSGFPRRAIEGVLQQAGLSLSEVDGVGVATTFAPGPIPDDAHNPGLILDRHRRMLSARGIIGGRVRQLASVGPTLPIRRQMQRTRRSAAYEQMFPGLQVQLFNHHACHAAAAYYSWGRLDDQVLVLTADGDGDDLSGSVSIGTGGRLRRVATIKREDSLGWVYEAVTFLLGLQPMEHEYKVMGLAPYATNSPTARNLAEQLHRLYVFDDPRTPLAWHRAPGVGRMNQPTRTIWNILKWQRFDHIAAAVQLFTEEALTSWVTRCIADTGIRRVALSGGIFLNVKANGRLYELDDIDEFYVMPACSDASNSLGAAYSMATQLSPDTAPQSLSNLFLGEAISDSDVKSALERRPQGLDVSWPDDTDVAVAKLLADGAIVGRATGRMEFGPRALGNRSILADPSRLNSVREINEMIKARDFWMPFAPSILSEDADRYLEMPPEPKLPSPSSRYMMLTFRVRDNHVPDIAAAMHPADQTARIQEVHETDNPSYHRLLTCFSSLTGKAALLNTSLNIHGSPIVRTATDALDLLVASGLRHLQLGSALISKAD